MRPKARLGLPPLEALTSAVGVHRRARTSVVAEIAALFLAGAIWRVHERLSFDFGLRAARAGSQSVRELRLGLTWSVPLAR